MEKMVQYFNSVHRPPREVKGSEEKSDAHAISNELYAGCKLHSAKKNSISDVPIRAVALLSLRALL